MLTLSEEAILLFLRENRWWFAINLGAIYIQKLRRFLKICKKEAYAFMIVPRLEIPDCLLPDEEEENPKGKGGEIPVELRDFEDVFDFIRAAALPHH